MQGRIAVSIMSLAFATLGLGSCSSYSPDGAPPSQLRPPINYPGGHQIFFRSEEAKHVVTLREDGNYLFETGDRSGRITSRRTGKWVWKKAGSHNAQLTLDTDIWELQFVDHGSAVAVNKSVRGTTHVFQFERPGSGSRPGPGSFPGPMPAPLPEPLPGSGSGPGDVHFEPRPVSGIDVGSVPSLPML